VLNLVLTSVVSLWCIMGAFRNSSAPIPHDSLHSSPFYFKGPWSATETPPKTRGHPGCNNKSKNHPMAHKRRSKPPQALSFRYSLDRVPRNHKTSNLCMLHTRPCDTPHTHNAPTIHFDIPLLHATHNIPSPHHYKI
jgi:hypothetical protein